MRQSTILVLLLSLVFCISVQAGEKIYFVHTDHLGTPQALTDAAQNTVWKAGDDPFGNAAPEVEQITNNIRFPGQYYDSESGLHYNWNRYYDPKLGRYITSDPIGLDGGLNTYLYAEANPLVSIDPWGLASCNGYWVKVRTVLHRHIVSVFTNSCTCFWSCYSCNGADAFPNPNPGQYTTPGKKVFQGNNPEDGDGCFCGEPGPDKVCDEPCE